MKTLLLALTFIAMTVSASTNILVARPVRVTAVSLTTDSFDITITMRCPEGDVTCDDVTYVAVNKQTKESVTRIGRKLFTYGPDGITPAHFLGYVFQKGGTVYFVSESAELTISHGPKEVLKEKGEWKK